MELRNLGENSCILHFKHYLMFLPWKILGWGIDQGNSGIFTPGIIGKSLGEVRMGQKELEKGIPAKNWEKPLDLVIPPGFFQP